jgi:hypothetical protein
VNAIFTGRKRRGKTTLAFDMAVKTGGGVVVFDPKREFRNWSVTVSDSDAVTEAIDNGHRIIVFQPVGDTEEAFAPLATLVMQLHKIAMEQGWDKTGNSFVLLIDEAHQLQNSWRINNELKNILSQCRPEILHIFQTIQSPADVYRVTRVCNSDWFLFQTTHPADVKRISEFAGDEVAGIVQRLGEHEYVHYSEDTSEYEVVTDSSTWFRPLQQTIQEEGNDVAKKKISFDDDSWSEFVKRLKKDLGLSKKNDDDNDDEDDTGDESEGFLIIPPKRKSA